MLTYHKRQALMLLRGPAGCHSAQAPVAENACVQKLASAGAPYYGVSGMPWSRNDFSAGARDLSDFCGVNR